MASSVQSTVIKRHSNRRLYNTRTGKYVSRKSLEAMARNGDDFVVFDATTGEDITRSVLGQIIVAQETGRSEPLLPIDFLRRSMGFYGDTLRIVLGCYLEFSPLTLTNESMRKQMAQAGTSVLSLVDEQVQRNIKFFETILTNLVPNSKIQIASTIKATDRIPQSPCLIQRVSFATLNSDGERRSASDCFGETNRRLT